jgi:hypothetical protein
MVVLYVTIILVDPTTQITHVKLSVGGKTSRDGTWALGNRPGSAFIASEEIDFHVQQEEVTGEFQDTAVFTPGTQQIGDLVDPINQACQNRWCDPVEIR